LVTLVVEAESPMRRWSGCGRWERVLWLR